MYIKHLMFGVNYTNKDGLRAATLGGYASAVTALFEFRGFSSPIDTSDPNNLGGSMINNCKKEEDIAVQRLPLSPAIFEEIRHMAVNSQSIDSEKHLMHEILCLAACLGPRLSEYGQTTANKVDYHTYPSGRQVAKAFSADDFVFLDQAGNKILELSEATASVAKKVRVTWKIQKNRQNGQAITVSSEDEKPLICPVRAALRMVLRARRLGQPDTMPVCCHSNTKKQRVYITGARIAVLLRAAAIKVHPNLSAQELKRYSAHSLRVWACVLLDEAGASPQFIKSRLRWLGNSFRMYLRDTSVIQDKHRDILRAALQETLDLVDDGVDQVTFTLDNMTTVEAESETVMGEYVDDED